MGIPIDIRDVLRSGAELDDARRLAVRLVVLIDAQAPQPIVDAVREAIRPQAANAYIRVEAVLPGASVAIPRDADAVIAVAGPDVSLAASLAVARTSGVPAVVVASGTVRDETARRLGHPANDVKVAHDPGAVVDELGVWLAQRLESKRIALAAGFAFVRRAVAEEAVRATAFQNAVIGVAAFLPGTDMPIMTANQIKMVLQIAAAYGEPLGAERVKELVAVLGGAFVFRGVARQAVSFLPAVGWALKGAVGYSGTMAMGYAAIKYFESGGGDPEGLARMLGKARLATRRITAPARNTVLPPAPGTPENVS